jgi:hypothetical protein
MMGTKEDGAAMVIVRGYAGQIRPEQCAAGKCAACREPVFVDASKISSAYKRVRYFHYSCAAL